MSTQNLRFKTEKICLVINLEPFFTFSSEKKYLITNIEVQNKNYSVFFRRVFKVVFKIFCKTVSYHHNGI